MNNCQWHRDGTLPRNESVSNVFVYGSNLLGQHIGGAAFVAHEKFGAVNGVALGYPCNEGELGGSYAIATLDENFQKLTLENIRQQVLLMLRWYKDLGADDNLFITRIGCGIAGFKDEEIAPMFQSFTKHSWVSLPDTWKQFLCKTNQPL